MSKVNVPYFSESAIYLAHLCAIETWHGASYVTGEQFEGELTLQDSHTKTIKHENLILSDEYFLDRLATQLFSIVKKSITNQYPTDNTFLDAFRKIAGIKGTERRGSKPDYTSGTAFLMKGAISSYRQYHRHMTVQDKIDEVIDCIEKLSTAFTYQTDPNIQTSEHTMLATRLLFFLMPNCLVFNYSSAIAKGLKLKGKPQENIEEYQYKLWEGLNLNWSTLCKFDMPLPKNLDPFIYNEAKKSGWWQRRIFDLALKNNYTHENTINVSSHVISSFYNKPNIIV